MSEAKSQKNRVRSWASLIPKVEALFQNRRNAVLLIVAVTLLLRAPYWFRDVINWDESTFIIMGRSIVDGYLPYTDFWDNKPPLNFFQFAAFLSITGDSIVSIRIWGAIYTAGISIFVYAILARSVSAIFCLSGGLMNVALMSLYWSGQATMSEHLALLPLIMACFILTKSSHPSIKTACAVGFLVSLAVLTRINLAFVAVAIGLIFLLVFRYKDFKTRIHVTISYALSGALPLVFLFLIYWQAGHIHDLWMGMFVVPMAYSSEQESAVSVFFELVDLTIGFSLDSTLRQLIGILFLLGVFLTLRRAWRARDLQSEAILLFLVCSAVAISMTVSGKSFPHYLLQMAPFFCIFAIHALHTIRTRSIVFSVIVLTLSCSAAYHAAKFPGYQTWNLVERLLNGEKVRDGRADWAASRINEQGLKDATILALSYHIVHQFTDTYPLTPLMVHPSNLVNRSILNTLYGPNIEPLDELNRALDQNPTFILVGNSYPYFMKHPEVSAELVSFLEQYRLLGEHQGALLYMRKEHLLED